MQIEIELNIEIEQYTREVVILLIEEKFKVIENEVLESIDKIICTIKLYIYSKKDNFFLYNKLSEILKYKQKDASH